MNGERRLRYGCALLVFAGRFGFPGVAGGALYLKKKKSEEE